MDPHVQLFVNAFKSVRWPTNPMLAGREHFLAGNRTLRFYRGDPAVLKDALSQYLATGSQPYAYAGAARIIAFGSYQFDGQFDPDGIAEALVWLDRAKALAPQDDDILLAEAWICVQAKEQDTARALLDRVRAGSAGTFDYLVTEIFFYDRGRNLDAVLNLIEAARATASNRRDLIYLLAIKSDLLMGAKLDEQAVEAFQERLEVSPTDPWGWHNLSIVYHRLNRLDEAWEANQRALSIIEFDAARQAQHLILRKIEKAGLRPPAPVAGSPPARFAPPIEAEKPRGIFGFYRRK